MSDLIASIRAAIDETERIARVADDASDRPWTLTASATVDFAADGEFYALDARVADHIVHHDPAAILRRCAADRELLDLHEHVPGDGINFTFAERDRSTDTIRALAEAYGLDVDTPG